LAFQKVLLATDFSPPAIHLLDCLDEFKPLGLEEVVLVHVIDERPQGGAAKALQGYDKELLEKNRAQLDAKGFKVKTITRVGSPTLEILKIAEEEQVSMIVIASHGQSIISGIFLGSTTKDLIRTSTIPILLEKYNDGDQNLDSSICKNIFKKVLLPIDFSVHSEMILELLLVMSIAFEETVLLSVIESAHNDEELLRRFEARECQLEKLKKDLEQQGQKVKTIILEGAASTNIIEVAEQEDITLIIMATRGEGLIKEILLGSTAHAVARRSKRPILLIPSPRA
jgi:nucleotide-binding universal stress UspA family protein